MRAFRPSAYGENSEEEERIEEHEKAVNLEKYKSRAEAGIPIFPEETRGEN